MHRRRITVLAVTTLVLLAAAYVAFDRDVVLWTRTTAVNEQQDDTSVAGFVERFAELTDDGRTAARLGGRHLPAG